LLGVSFLVGAGWPQSVAAADADSAKVTDNSPPEDTKGAEIIKHSFEFYRRLKSFSFTLSINLKENGVANPKEKSLFEMSFARPNNCSIDLVEGTLGGSAFSDGKTFFVYNKPANQYVSLPAPAQIAQVMESPAYLSLDRGLLLLSLTHTLVAPDPYATLTRKGSVKVTYIDTAKIDNIECDHLRMAHLDIWLRKSGDPWIQRVTADIPSHRADTGEASTKKITLIYDYSKQSTGDVPEAKFAFTPPKGAEAVKLPERGSEAAHPLTGKPAPNFTVDTLDGKKFELAKNKGHVVVLDFWATWCPPCRMGLPVVTAVTKSFQDKGVVFLAVNVRESAKQINDFFEKVKISPNVGLDKDGAVSSDYKAEGIPQTVIIDKSGTIAKIDVGFSPDLKEELTKTISGLLSGATSK
jgi:thiol-disulfide isomerase/thioredoxin